MTRVTYIAKSRKDIADRRSDSYSRLKALLRSGVKLRIKFTDEEPRYGGREHDLIAVDEAEGISDETAAAMWQATRRIWWKPWTWRRPKLEITSCTFEKGESQ